MNSKNRIYTYISHKNLSALSHCDLFLHRHSEVHQNISDNLKTKRLIDNIGKHIARFKAEVETLNSIGLYDINLHAENVLIPLLNTIYDINLVNLNAEEKKNFPAVDLADFKNRISYQVSSTVELSKVEHTVNKFIEHKLETYFDRVVVLLLQKKKAYSSKSFEKKPFTDIGFNPTDSILDLDDLYKMINTIISTEKLEAIERLLRSEFADIQIEQRKKRIENGYILTEPESIYYNMVRVEFSKELYIADVDFEEQELTNRLNEKREEKDLKLKKSFKKEVLIKEGLRVKSQLCNDWILSGNQLITFHNLHAESPLVEFIDKGTITTIEVESYYSQNDDQLRTYKWLLREVLTDHCYGREMEAFRRKKKPYLLRFKNNRKAPRALKTRWIGKKESTKTVIFEVMNKERSHIVCFRHLAFIPLFELINGEWYLIINPTWSFTNPGGYLPSRYESTYAKGIKEQENNQTVYYLFRFLGYFLSKTGDLFFRDNQHIKIFPPEPFKFSPSLIESKWKELNRPLSSSDVDYCDDNELNPTLFE